MKRNRTHMAFLFFLVGLLASGQCLANTIEASGVWVSGNSHLYQLVLKPTTPVPVSIDWDSARGETQSLYPGFHLATITSDAEMAFINDLLAGIIGEYWIGGYQDGTEATPADGWHWVTGANWNYTNWGPGEPNDWENVSDSSLLHNEQHLALFHWQNTPEWQWNDEGYFNSGNGIWQDGWIGGYLMESFTPVPEPATLLLMGTGLFALGANRRRMAARKRSS